MKRKDKDDIIKLSKVTIYLFLFNVLLMVIVALRKDEIIKIGDELYSKDSITDGCLAILPLSGGALFICFGILMVGGTMILYEKYFAKH